MQLHRERTEQVAAACAVAGLARLLQRGGGGANASRTDRLRGALERATAATFARSPVREATSISRSASIAVSRNFPNSASMAAQSSPSRAASTFRSIAAVGSP
jgi:hypothetical protein